MPILRICKQKQERVKKNESAFVCIRMENCCVCVVSEKRKKKVENKARPENVYALARGRERGLNKNARNSNQC